MSNDENSEQMRKLFIGGLSFSTTEETLKKHFEKYGQIVDCVVMTEPQTHKSRGFGFITYSTIAELEKCQEDRPHKIDGRNVEPKRAMPREESQKSNHTVKKIFVGGLKDVINDQDLKEYFSEFGKIESVEIITEKGTDKRRGFGFVLFEDYDPVDKIILVKNHNLKNLKLDVKKAIPKDQMSGGRDRKMGGDDYGRRSSGYRDDYRGSRDYPPRSANYDSYSSRSRGGGGYDSYSSSYYEEPRYRESFSNGYSGSGGGSGGYGRDSYGSGGGGGGPMRSNPRDYNAPRSAPYGQGYSMPRYESYGGTGYGRR